MESADRRGGQNESWAFLKKNRKLIVTSCFGSLIHLGGMALFVASAIKLDIKSLHTDYFMLKFFGLFYLYNTLLIMPLSLLCDLAVFDYTISQLSGGTRTLTSAIASSVWKWPRLLLWSVYCSTIRIGKGFRRGGEDLFVLPIMAAENLGPIAALHQSKELIHDGLQRHQAGRSFSIHIPTGLGCFGIVTFLLIVFGVMYFDHDGIVTIYVVFGSLVLLSHFVRGFDSAQRSVLIAASYVFVRDKAAPKGFSALSLESVGRISGIGTDGSN